MENNRSNEEALAAHREAFYREVDDYFSKFDSSHALVKSRSDYADLIMFLSGPAKDKTVKKSKADYYAMKNYVVMQCNDILDPQLDQGYCGEFRVLSLLTFS